MIYICQECLEEVEIQVNDPKGKIPYGIQNEYLINIIATKLKDMCLECIVADFIKKMVPKQKGKS